MGDDINEKLDVIVDVLRTLCDKVDWHDQVLDNLTSSKLTDRLDSIEDQFGKFTGGLNDIIDGRRKREWGNSFREKYPDFAKYEKFGQGLGMDVYGTAADSTYGMSDEELEQAIPAMLKELSEKFDAVKSALDELNAHEATETPAEEKAEQGENGGEGSGGMSVEVTTGEVNPKLLEMARKFKQRGKE